MHRLNGLRTFDGPPTAFWPDFLKALVEVSDATSGAVVIRGADGERKSIAVHPRSAKVLDELLSGAGDLDELTGRAEKEGAITVPPKGGAGAPGHLVMADVTPVGTTTAAFALLRLPDFEPGPLGAIVARLQLAREIPSVYSLQRRLHRAEEDVGTFASSLDLLRVVDARSRYLEAVMTLLDELAARFHCERVSLGWLEKGEVRLQAISHTEKIEKKMGAVRAMEEVMEEALDQDTEVVFPPPPEGDAISRSHEKFARDQDSGNVASLPMRIGDEPVAVLMLEHSSVEFDEHRMRSLRLLCDQVVTRLADRKKHDRWFGARWWTAFRSSAAKLVGVEHTGWKLTGLALAIGLAVLIFGGGIHRVEAPFLLRSDTLAQVPAAFQGYIEEVNYRVGDRVSEGDLLLTLDTRQLLLEESSTLAEIQRHHSDARSAEAEGKLAQMRIAVAQADQAQAKLDLIRYRLQQSRITAPFDGVIVEGDLRERISSPVDQGEVLLKVARLDEMYVEGKVHERNIHLLAAGSNGQMAFASQPQHKFPITVERIEPLAVPDEEGNQFTVRCDFAEDMEDWWRPGMSGVCKLESERRSYLWMLTRRTVDFLRMKLWL